MINIISSPRNGKVVTVKAVDDDAELMIITMDGQMIRTRVNEVSVIGRNTQGVTILDTSPESRVTSVAIIEEDKEEDKEEEKEPE
jgi:DNA gyrase subunit A